MDDLQRAIAKRKSRDTEFAKTFDNIIRRVQDRSVVERSEKKRRAYTGSSGRQAE